MRRSGNTSTLAIVSALMGTAIALSGCSPGRSAEPDPAVPGRSASPTADPQPSAEPSPAPSDRPLTKTAEPPPAGLDVRYVDSDGNFQVLRVEDFPK